jgi:hypothetical protein
MSIIPATLEGETKVREIQAILVIQQNTISKKKKNQLLNAVHKVNFSGPYPELAPLPSLLSLLVVPLTHRWSPHYSEHSAGWVKMSFK